MLSKLSTDKTETLQASVQAQKVLEQRMTMSTALPCRSRIQ